MDDQPELPAATQPENGAVEEIKPVEAPKVPEQPSGGSWWGWNVISTLKAKAEEVVEAAAGDLGELVETTSKNLDDLIVATKKDLGEFVATVETEAVSVVSEAATALSGKEGEGGVGGWLASLADDRKSPAEEPRNLPAGYDRRVLHIQALQANPATFVTEPEDADDYGAWEKGINLDQRTDEIAALVSESSALRAAQANLVPKVISYDDFWKRYFYKVHLYDVQEAQREDLKKKVLEGGEEPLGWDEEDEEDTTTELKPKTDTADQKEAQEEERETESTSQPDTKDQHETIQEPQAVDDTDKTEASAQSETSNTQAEEKTAPHPGLAKVRSKEDGDDWDSWE
eukprot:comp23394_c0_seq1/m.38782 comp23394_c0_seq1/g.38782  ORF comp23394_c0_seq1/g.38782 comp23394_c0_seq1/m.38782 type:complete len:343 (-) comp23394_c0_seq1:394-1422(-)